MTKAPSSTWLFPSSVFLCCLAFLAAGCASFKVNSPAPDARAPSLPCGDPYAIFINGKVYEIAGSYDMAEALYRRVIECDSNALYVRYLLARGLFFRNRNDSAEALLAPVVARDTTFDYFVLWGDLLYRKKELTDALNAYEIALARSAGDPRIIKTLAYLYEETGQYEKAAAYYESLEGSTAEQGYFLGRAAELYGMARAYGKAFNAVRELFSQNQDAPEARLRLRALAAAPEAFPEAVALLKEYIDSRPGDVSLRRDLGSVYLKAGDYAAAEAIFNVLYQQHGGFSDGKTWGILLSLSGKYAEAEQLLLKLKAEKSDADILFYLGNAALGLEKYLPAADWYAACIAADSNFSAAYTNRVVAFLRHGSVDSAIAVFTRAAVRFPAEMEPIYLLGVARANRGDYPGAITAYQKALELDSLNLGIMFDLASSYERNGVDRKAMDLFLAIIQRDPRNDRSLNYLGYMYAERDMRLDSAEAYIQRALEREPDNGAYLDSYGWVMFKKRNYAEAEKFIFKAIRSREEDPVIYEHMAIIKESAGDLHGARNYWRKVIELDPKNTRARKALAPADGDTGN